MAATPSWVFIGLAPGRSVWGPSLSLSPSLALRLTCNKPLVDDPNPPHPPHSVAVGHHVCRRKSAPILALNCESEAQSLNTTLEPWP